MSQPAPRVVKPRKMPRSKVERLCLQRMAGTITEADIDSAILWWEWLDGIGRMWSYIARWEAHRRSP